MRLVLTLIGFAGRRPQVPRAFRARAIDDTGLVADQLSQWADLPQLQRIIMSRGTIIDTAPAEVLRLLADTLSPREVHHCHSGSSPAPSLAKRH